jgi:hypothetical protein
VQPSSLFGELSRRIKWIGNPVPKSEWDFSSLFHKKPNELQRHELRAAVFYEYARESPTIRKLAVRFSKLPRKLREEIELSRWSNYPLITPKLFFFTSLPFSHCILWPKFFPGTPWLEILIAERCAAVKRYIERTSATLFEIKGYEEVKEWKEWELSDEKTRRFKTSGFEYLPIAINWTAGSNDQIIAAFANWVRRNRPRQFQDLRSGASRKNVTAAFLKRIAVMRLLHNCSHDDALDLAERHGLKFPKQQSNALLMRQRVRGDIPLLFQSQAFEANMGTALIPRTEYPRSWKTFSDRRRIGLKTR